jgi:hypothetical protein
MAGLVRLTSNIDRVLASFKEAREARVREFYDQIVYPVALQLILDAQRISPVDTGLYRSAHDLTINETSTLHAGKTAPEIFEAGTMTDQQTQIDLAISRLDGARESFKGTISIFLTNNLQYAWALENGHSQQAPQGVYGIVRQRAIENFKKGGLSI